MQVLFNRSILSILSDALNFARHWIRSKNPTIQNIDSRRFTDLIALDTSQFHFFLSFFFLLHCPMNTTRETFSIILSQSSMLERKEKGKHPEQQRDRSIPDLKKKKKLLNYRQLTRYTSLSSIDLVSLFSCTAYVPQKLTGRYIYLFLYGKSLMTLVIREWKR